LFRDRQGLWRVDDTDHAVYLLDFPDDEQHISVSPDGKRVLFQKTLRVVDLATGHTLHLDTTDEYVFYYATWWAAKPDVVVAAIQPGTELMGMYPLTLLASVTLDSLALSVLGREPTSVGRMQPRPTAAPSPSIRTMRPGSTGGTGVQCRSIRLRTAWRLRPAWPCRTRPGRPMAANWPGSCWPQSQVPA
jgi:hypothetical protein